MFGLRKFSLYAALDYPARQKGFVLNTTVATVAIVGTHPNTRDDAPYLNKDVDIWIFNNQAIQGWVQRADACFDIHHPNDIHRRRLEHPAFNDWLAKQDAIPIYTPYPITDCPRNEVYPLEEVVADLFPNFKRGKDTTRYFTSGPCYALALAIHKGYKRIEFYGIEMESNSEYIYQRDGIGLFFGIALGRGIEMFIPEKSLMFYSPLYGYDDDATKLSREAFETRASELQQVLEQTFAIVNSTKGELVNVVGRIDQARIAGKPVEEIQKFGMEYERAQNAYEQAIANHAFVNGQYLDCRTWQARIEKGMEFEGKAQELNGLTHDKWDRFADKEALGIIHKKGAP